MNFCGVICEFNPFHNGHEYLISQAKEKTQSEIICLMSGNFVQRGIPSIQSKYERAKHAILAGANAVLELPTIYACSNAENFANGAIKIFKSLSIKQIAFGIEKTNLDTLVKIAKLKYENSERFQNAFKNEIQNGINYNTALKRSIANTIGDEEIINVLNKPNNVLAVEYLTAILKQNANIEPIAIERCDDGYESNIPISKFLSASNIRNLIETNKSFTHFTPNYTTINEHFDVSHKKILETLIILKIRNSTPQQLEKHYDYSEGIEYRIKEMADKFTNLDEIKNHIATPRYRLPRVNKLLLYPLLNITKTIISAAKITKPAVKVLAINKKNIVLLKEYNKQKITLITTNKEYENLSKSQKQIFDIDLNASNIYNAIICQENNKDKKIGTIFL